MISMILCWVLYSKGIIDLALPIVATIFFIFSGTLKVTTTLKD